MMMLLLIFVNYKPIITYKGYCVQEPLLEDAPFLRHNIINTHTLHITRCIGS
jgi:hypothetical protein